MFLFELSSNSKFEFLFISLYTIDADFFGDFDNTELIFNSLNLEDNFFISLELEDNAFCSLFFVILGFSLAESSLDSFIIFIFIFI